MGSEDSQGSSAVPSYLKKNSENNTFGSIPITRSKKYGRMEDGGALEMTCDFDNKDESQENVREIADDDSERAIWQTKSVTVEHGLR